MNSAIRPEGVYTSHYESELSVVHLLIICQVVIYKKYFANIFPLNILSFVSIKLSQQ